MDFRIFYKVLYVLAVLSCILFIRFYLLPFEKSERILHAPKPMGYRYPLTIHTNGGRLGNQMFTYATLLGLSALNNRNMHIFAKNYDVLSKYFDIQTPVVDTNTFVESNPWMIGNWLTEKDRSIPITTNIIKGNIYPTSYTFFDHARKKIQETFSFKPSYRKHAQDVLWKMKKERPDTQVFIGVHIRRGDYLKHSQGGWLRGYDGREVDREYFEKSMEYFTSKYKNVTFLAISDDREWCRTNLTDLGIITTPDSPSAGHDLALLAECNHTIMTYGTYGFWGGYLSGGEVVYFADFLKPNSTFLLEYFVYDKMYPPHWIGISTTKPGFWESYTNPYLT